jgi:predicted small secreted protein
MSLRIPYNSLQSSKKLSSNKSLKKGSSAKKNYGNINGETSQAHSFFHSTKSKDAKSSAGSDVSLLPLDNQLDSNNDVIIIDEK